MIKLHCLGQLNSLLPSPPPSSPPLPPPPLLPSPFPSPLLFSSIKFNNCNPSTPRSDKHVTSPYNIQQTGNQVEGAILI